MSMAFREQRDDRDTRGFINEEDRINCPFYHRIGSCRNGDRCTRAHNKPSASQTLLLPHLYPNSPESMAIANDDDWDEAMYARAQEHVEIFYEEVFLELAKYGEIEDMVVLDNVAEHMRGSVYVKYYQDGDAERALKGLGNRFYDACLIQPEYSPVMDFRDARCRAFHETRCNRGGLCNFMHIKHIPRAVKRRLVRQMYVEHPGYKGAGLGPPRARGRSRSRSPKKDQAAEKEKSGEAEKENEKDNLPKETQQSSSAEDRRAMIAQWNRERAGELESQAASLLGITAG